MHISIKPRPCFEQYGKYPLFISYSGRMPRTAGRFILIISPITTILEDSCVHFYFVDEKSKAPKLSGELKKAHTRRLHSRVSEVKSPAMGRMNL